MAKRKARKGVYFPDDIVRMVEEFPSAHHGGTTFSPRVQEMLRDLSSQLARAWREVEHVFQEAEWNYLRDMLNGTLLTGDISYRTALAAEAEDADTYEGLGEKWGVNVPALIEKIRGLAEFQAYAVVKAVDKYWARKEKEK